MTTPADAPPAPTPPADAPPAPPATPTPPPTSAAEDVTQLPEWAQKQLRDARAEAGKARTSAKEQAAAEARAQLAQEFGKVLGLVDDKPDPAKLTAALTEREQTLTAAQSALRTRDLELAAWKAADKASVKAGALLDSRSFVDAISGLDPAADDFTTKLDAAVKAAADGNPLLRVSQAPPRGGSEFPGGPGGEARPASLEDAVAAKMTAAGG